MYHLKEKVVSQIEVKKSKFLCVLMPLDDDKQIKEEIKQLKKEYPKATHYCYGSIINGMHRSNDDGEPASTAGKPILEALKYGQLDNVLAVVIRYFGGTLLGTAGLVKAYGSVVTQTINNATLTISKNMYVYCLEIDYSLTSKIEYLLSKNSEIISRDYSDSVKYIYQCENPIDDLIIEASNGQCLPTLIESKTIEIEVKNK